MAKDNDNMPMVLVVALVMCLVALSFLIIVLAIRTCHAEDNSSPGTAGTDTVVGHHAVQLQHPPSSPYLRHVEVPAVLPSAPAQPPTLKPDGTQAGAFGLCAAPKTVGNDAADNINDARENHV